jgi:spore coat protein CotF
MQQQQQQQMGQVQPQFTWEGGHLVMFHKEATGLPQVKDANVNDRDRMQDLLATEKYMTQGYNISMNEAGHDALFQVLKQNHDDCQQLQRQIFNGMFKKGWYKLPVADAQSVAHTYNQFKQYQTQFPFPWQGSQQANGSTQQIKSGTAQTTSSSTSIQTGAQGQQLNQVVDQAIRQAQQGQVPSGYAGSRTSH